MVISSCIARNAETDQIGSNLDVAGRTALDDIYDQIRSNSRAIAISLIVQLNHAMSFLPDKRSGKR
jgi:hypothetical protein